MSTQRYPDGWDEDRVRRLLTHYDQMDEAEQVAEDEAAAETQGQTLMIVPTNLVSALREIIAKNPIH